MDIPDSNRRYSVETKGLIAKIIKYSVMVTFAVMCIYPMVWLLLNSFKTNAEVFQNPWGLPARLDFSNYARALIVGNIGVNFLNSIFITLISVVVSVFLSSMCSYGLVRMKWKMSGKVRSLVLLGMSIPTYAAIVPLFAIFNKMGLINEFPSVIIAHICFALPMSIFIISGFLSTIPVELRSEERRGGEKVK